MIGRSRLIGAMILTGVAAGANAQIVYSNVTATVSYLPAGGFNIPWATQGPFNQIIDFFAGQVPVVVGDSTQNVFATVNIVYEANSSNAYAVSQIGMVIQGSVFDWGRITWSETVEDLNNGGVVVGQKSGEFLGASYTGGSNGAINFSDTLVLSSPVTYFKVKKTFTLDIDGQTLPTPTLATLGLVEQNLVPEPATAAAIGIGLLSLAALRRRSR